MTDAYLTYGDRIKSHIADTSRLVLDRLDDGDLVVFEGAQGTLLDIDHGTYPFVTSSNPIAGAACIGAGVGPKHIDEVLGITKAYTHARRLGTLPDRTRGLDRRIASGGRRRVRHDDGPPSADRWLDLVALRYAARINSMTALAITKLDVLSGQSVLPVCTRYRGADGAVFDHFPYHQTVMHQVTGEYDELPGWTEDLSECRSEDDLPQTTREYLQFISEFVNVPVALIGVGPSRDAVIWTRAGRRMSGDVQQS